MITPAVESVTRRIEQMLTPNLLARMGLAPLIHPTPQDGSGLSFGCIPPNLRGTLDDNRREASLSVIGVAEFVMPDVVPFGMPVCRINFYRSMVITPGAESDPFAGP